MRHTVRDLLILGKIKTEEEVSENSQLCFLVPFVLLFCR